MQFPDTGVELVVQLADLVAQVALSAQQAHSKIAVLFSTHPSLEKRQAQLAKISAQLGQH